MVKLMNLLCNKKELRQLNAWGKKFWETYEKKRDRNFAQQGYEDKGYGHIERIIGNVEELLENYCELLYQLNYPADKPGDTAPSKEGFENKFLKILKPTLIMFFLAAILHDIGMTLPGIFKALKDVLTVSDDSAQHVSAIVHNYHNYGSFILLLELNHIEIDEKNGEIKTKKYAFLDYIPEKNKNQHIGNLVTFKKFLSTIYNEHFKNAEKNSFDKDEFFVILAIICLVHQEVDIEDVRSILRRFQPGHDNTVKLFNKWWDFFNRAREWTLSAPKWLPQYLNPENKKEKDIFPELIQFSEAHLDVLLTSALLQYGDKTEITIARLTKELDKTKSGGKENENTPQTSLEKFWFDTQWDNQDGYICTEMAQRVISDFSRFRACRFIPLFLVKTRNHPGTNPPRLDVVMHYFRFPADKDVFPLIRYHDEKDFSDLKFLDVIKVHIPLLIHNFKNKNPEIKKNILVDINLRRKEYPFPTVDDEQKKLVQYFFTTRKRMADLKIDIIKISLQTLMTVLKQEKIEVFIDEKKEPFEVKIDELAKELKAQILGRIKKQDLKEPPQKDINKITIDDSYPLRLSYKEKMEAVASIENLEEKVILEKIRDELIARSDFKKAEQKKYEEILKASGDIHRTIINILKNSVDNIQNKKLADHLIASYKKNSRENRLYGLDEELEGLLYDSSDHREKIVKALTSLQGKIESSSDRISLEERFPYTPQNRKVIAEFSRSIRKPGFKNKELFHETSDLIIPSSFELLAILNLYRQEE